MQDHPGERRKPALGQFGELTVDQARTMAQEWLAEVRKGGDPSAAKNTARKAPVMKEYCHIFMIACTAPCWPRFRAIPPEQPEHDHVATVLFFVG